VAAVYSAELGGVTDAQRALFYGDRYEPLADPFRKRAKRRA